MLSVAAASREGRRVVKAPRKPHNAPVKNLGFKRNGSNPAFLDLLADNISLDTEGPEALEPTATAASELMCRSIPVVMMRRLPSRYRVIP
jgi:hypothetical protein